MQKNIRSSPLVGIVVLHWNNFEDTKVCLDSIRKLSYQRKNIYIVNNHSSNDSLSRLISLFKEFNFIALNLNLGFAGGMNKGIKRAIKDKADAVMILNNDTCLEKESLGYLVEKLFQNKKTGVVVPMVYLGLSGKTVGSIGGEIHWPLGEARHIGYLEKDKGQFKSRKVKIAPGSALIVKTKLINKVGLIPEDYFLYNEDVDWSVKFINAGYDIITVPKAHIWHNESAAAGPQSPMKTYYYTRNNLIFMSKYVQEGKWFSFLLNFYCKMTKLTIKFLIKGKGRNIIAIFKGSASFWRGERGFSQNYIPKIKEQK